MSLNSAVWLSGQLLDPCPCPTLVLLSYLRTVGHKLVRTGKNPGPGAPIPWCRNTEPAPWQSTEGWREPETHRLILWFSSYLGLALFSTKFQGFPWCLGGHWGWGQAGALGKKHGWRDVSIHHDASSSNTIITLLWFLLFYNKDIMPDYSLCWVL